jgi:hypothetical protein
VAEMQQALGPSRLRLQPAQKSCPPPNKSLQRTRVGPSGLRSPLSSNPLGVTKVLLCVCLLVLWPLSALGAAPRSLATGSRVRVFFPKVKLVSADGERIQALEIKMACGRFRGVSNIPNDWSMTVVSPVSEQTTLRAAAGHGATTLWHLEELDGAVTVSVQEASCFDISATVSSTSRSFEFSRSKLVLKP